MLNKEDFEEKTLKREILFEGKIIELALDQVALPNGGTAERELIFHNGGVGIIAITEEDKLLLVKQFRKPLERVILEIPAGKIDPGEDPAETAYRELEEETGYTSEQLDFVAAMYLSPGFANEKLHLYYTNQLIQVENPLPQDEDEVLELYALTLEEAKAAIETEEICDAKTIYAITYWELLKRGGTPYGKSVNHTN